MTHVDIARKNLVKTTIMETYERIDIRRRTKELTDLEFGSKKDNPETIRLFDY